MTCDRCLLVRASCEERDLHAQAAFQRQAIEGPGRGYVPRSQAVAEAPALQQTIFEYDPRFLNPATVAYQALVDRVYYG